MKRPSKSNLLLPVCRKEKFLAKGRRTEKTESSSLDRDLTSKGWRVRFCRSSWLMTELSIPLYDCSDFSSASPPPPSRIPSFSLRAFRAKYERMDESLLSSRFLLVLRTRGCWVKEAWSNFGLISCVERVFNYCM